MVAFGSGFLADALEAGHAELKALRDRKAELDAERALLEARILKREAFIEATTALLNELVSEATPEKETRAPEVPWVPATPPEIALNSYPRSGYGAVTGAVERLLQTNAAGYSARELADILRRHQFEVKESHEDAVRSAVKNLRNQKKAFYDKDSGRYRLSNQTKKAQEVSLSL
jgi:hypothetical protein